MGRNIVICCDGTANEFARDRTNVVKLYYTLVQAADKQITFYHPGLGTMEPPGALTNTARAVTRTMGLAVGYGLEDDIRDAYTYLINHFQDDDRVFIFGFSRGAYTARSVCSLIAMYGLILPGNDALVPYAIRMMMAVDKAEKQPNGFQDYLKLAGEFRGMMCRTTCKPHFVGVWDTVSSVGWVENPLHLPMVADNPTIQIGRHAIAIDERRAFFRTNRWIPNPKLPEHGPKDVKQVWFPGVHCDVGGGYPEAESGLSKFALEWMLCEAIRAGLLVNPQRMEEVLGRSPGSQYVRADANAVLHESLTRAWQAAEWVPKPHYDWNTGKTSLRMNRGKRRTIPPGSLIHESVIHRANGLYARGLGLAEDHEPIERTVCPEPAAS